MPWYIIRNTMLVLLSAACIGYSGWVVYSFIYEPESYAVRIGDNFSLVDGQGDRVTRESLKGRFLLIYFGYTYCPDICPTKLVTMTNALDYLEASAPERAARLTPVFITLDPKRDTPEQMGAYIQHFHPRFIALSGSAEEIAAVAKAYKIYYREVPTDDGLDYILDHTSYIFLMGPDGRYVAHFNTALDSEQLAEQLTDLVPDDNAQSSRDPG